MAITTLDLQRLWISLRRILSVRSLLRRLAHWVFCSWRLLRRSSHIRYYEQDGKRPTTSTPPQPPTGCVRTGNVSTETDIDTQSDANTNMSTTLFHQNNASCLKDLDTISLFDPAIAFSQHPYYSFTEPSRAVHIPRRPIPIRAFNSNPTLPVHPLDGTLAVPGTQRDTVHSDFFFPVSDSVSLYVPELEDTVRIPRAPSPSSSIIYPLPPVEGPAGEPIKLSGGLREPSEKYDPLIPSNHQRYQRNVKMPDESSMEIELEPLRMSYSYGPDPLGWTSYLHPEGVRYFCDTERRIYTDANMYHDGKLQEVNEAIEGIYEFMQTNSVVLPPTADLVLDFIDGTVYYYFADHKTRTVFYLDKMKTTDFVSWYEVEGASSLSHFGHLIEAEYWWHVLLFPSSLTIGEDIINELRDILIHGIGDTMTCPLSTMEFGNDDLHKVLSVTNSLQKNVGTTYGGSICTLSRFMWSFSRNRFLHWHGEPAVRLTRDASAHGRIQAKVLPWALKIVSWLLFSAPDVHLRKLEKIWVDKTVYHHIWKQTISRLMDAWQGFTLFSTVLLNANVAFLAIQTIDQANHPYRSPGQVASYLSTIASIGSIILSLLLTRMYRTKEKEDAFEVSDFLIDRDHPRYGHATLAIVHSLPYALLMWGVVSFLIAIAWMCMADANPTTRILTGLAWLFVAVMIALCVWIGWEKRPSEDEALQDDASSMWSTKSVSFRKKLRMPFPVPILRRSPTSVHSDDSTLAV